MTHYFFKSLIFILILFASCTPQQKLQRLLKKHPELQKKDTTWTRDTVYINSRSVDTVFYYKQTDTIIKKENGAIIKYYYNTKDSTVYLRGECDTIRIIREVPTAINTVELKERNSFWDWFVRGLLIFISGGLFFVIFLFIKTKK